jgi:hypothetical protein
MSEIGRFNVIHFRGIIKVGVQQRFHAGSTGITYINSPATGLFQATFAVFLCKVK